MYELSPVYDVRASFYGKAQVEVNGNIETLYSYGTPVVTIDKGSHSVELLDNWDTSQTTLRHVKEFLKQNDFVAENKAQIAESAKGYGPFSFIPDPKKPSTFVPFEQNGVTYIIQAESYPGEDAPSGVAVTGLYQSGEFVNLIEGRMRPADDLEDAVDVAMEMLNDAQDVSSQITPEKMAAAVERKTAEAVEKNGKFEKQEKAEKKETR